MSIELDFSHPLAPDGWCVPFVMGTGYGRELVTGQDLIHTVPNTPPNPPTIVPLPPPYGSGLKRPADTNFDKLSLATPIRIVGQSFTTFVLCRAIGLSSFNRYFLHCSTTTSSGNPLISLSTEASQLYGIRHDNGFTLQHNFLADGITMAEGDVYALFYRRGEQGDGTRYHLEMYCIDGPNKGYNGQTESFGNNGSGFVVEYFCDWSPSSSNNWMGDFIATYGWRRPISDEEVQSIMYDPWQIFKPAVGYVAVEPRSDTFRLLEIQGAPTETGIDITLVDSTGTALPNLSNLSWAWFDQSTIDSASTPTDVGNTGSTDGSGLLSLTLPNTTLTTGQTGMLALRDSTGMIYALYRVTI